MTDKAYRTDGALLPKKLYRDRDKEYMYTIKIPISEVIGGVDARVYNAVYQHSSTDFDEIAYDFIKFEEMDRVAL